MLLYVTIGEGEPAAPESRPLPTLPQTVAALYDLGMRHHRREGALLRWTAERQERLPDWRLDRMVIRVALYCRERLGLEPGDRVALLGELSWLWPVAEFAAMGFGAVPVGLEQGLDEAGVAAALDEAGPRIGFATDAASAARLLRSRELRGQPQSVIGPAGLAQESPGLVPLDDVLERGATLDTAERAQNFRLASRSVAPDQAACWHFDAAGAFTRLTHAEAMAHVARRVSARPAQPGDLGYLEAAAVSLSTRLAYYVFVGDGYTTTALGRRGLAHEDLRELEPHKLLVSGTWMDETWAGIEADSDGPRRRLARLLPGARWLRALDRRGPRLRRALRARVGDRLRWIEATGLLPDSAAAAWREAGVEVFTEGVRRREPEGARAGPEEGVARRRSEGVTA
jgi:hypothetical protein